MLVCCSQRFLRSKVVHEGLSTSEYAQIDHLVKRLAPRTSWHAHDWLVGDEVERWMSNALRGHEHWLIDPVLYGCSTSSRRHSCSLG